MPLHKIIAPYIIGNEMVSGTRLEELLTALNIDGFDQNQLTKDGLSNDERIIRNFIAR